jgi:hypothetical protein
VVKSGRVEEVMRVMDKKRGAAKEVSSSCPNKRRLPMWIRFTSLTLALALAGSVALGMPLHSSDRGCNMPMEMTGCEHMGMEPSAPGVSPTALCCLLDCQQPGPTGTAFNLRIPSFSVAFLHQAVPAPTVTLPRPLPQAKWLESTSFKPPEPYLKNLALLI